MYFVYSAAAVPNVTLHIHSSSTSAKSGGAAAAAGNGIQAVVNNDVSTLQQEENVSISGSNARLMIMKKLSRKAEVGVVLVPFEWLMDLAKVMVQLDLYLERPAFRPRSFSF